MTTEEGWSVQLQKQFVYNKQDKLAGLKKKVYNNLKDSDINNHSSHLISFQACLFWCMVQSFIPIDMK